MMISYLTVKYNTSWV